MKVLVCGGRDFSDKEFTDRELDRLHAEHHFTLLIHGDANGADTLAGSWASIRGVPCTPVPANWKKYGRGAGPKRNQQMLAMNPDLVIAFPGGRGTAHMVGIAKAKMTRVIELKP